MTDAALPRRRMRREFISTLNDDVSRLGASAGLSLSGGKLWFSVEVHCGATIRAVTLVGQDPASAFRLPLFIAPRGATVRHASGHVAAPDPALLHGGLLDRPGVWLEVRVPGRLLRGALQEVASAWEAEETGQ